MTLKLLTRDDLEKDIITVSPTQLSTWYTCRYKWKLNKLDGIEGIPVKERGAQNKGLIFHFLQEWYYNHFIGKQVRSLTEKGKAAALEAAQQVFESDPDFWSVFTIWCIYTEWAEQFENIIPLGVEHETFAPTGLVSRDGRPIYLHGFIDLFGEIDSKLAVVDHKSHTSRPWTEQRLNYDHQFVIYWLLLELQGYPVDVAIVNAVDLFISKNPETFRKTLQSRVRFDRFARFYRTHKTLKLQFYLDQLLESIKEMWVRPNPVYEMRLTDQCQWCNYKAHIEMDAAGQHEGAVVTLKARHNTDISGFEIIDDLDSASA